MKTESVKHQKQRSLYESGHDLCIQNSCRPRMPRPAWPSWQSTSRLVPRTDHMIPPPRSAPILFLSRLISTFGWEGLFVYSSSSLLLPEASTVSLFMAERGSFSRKSRDSCLFVFANSQRGHHFPERQRRQRSCV